MKSRWYSYSVPVVVLGAVLLAAPAAAQDSAARAFAAVPVPAGLDAGNADLAIKGKIGRSEGLYLDLKTIKSFPSVSFKTWDPWDGKTYEFTGVLLADLLAWAGMEANASSLLMTARNNYSIPIKREDYEKYGYILAYRLDGKDFASDPATKKRGALAIAIDFSKHKELAPEIYKHQLIWQLSEILAR